MTKPTETPTKGTLELILWRLDENAHADEKIFAELKEMRDYFATKTELASAITDRNEKITAIGDQLTTIKTDITTLQNRKLVRSVATATILVCSLIINLYAIFEILRK